MKSKYLILLFVLITLNGCYKEKESESCPRVEFEINTNQNSFSIFITRFNYGFVEVEYGPNGFTKGSGILTNSTSASGLSDGTYDVYIRGNCGGNDWSAWSGPRSFLISNGGGSGSCARPTNLDFGYYTSCAYLLSWESNTDANYYEIEYGSSGFNIGNGTRDISNDNGYTDGSFSKNTLYDFYVRAKCGSEWSDWSDVGSFYSTENIRKCIPPLNVQAYRSGNYTVEYSYESNGECEYQHALVSNGASVSSGNLSTSSNSSGGFYSVSSSFASYDFYIRAVCESGYSSWVKVDVD